MVKKIYNEIKKFNANKTITKLKTIFNFIVKIKLLINQTSFFFEINIYLYKIAINILFYVYIKKRIEII